MVNGDPGWFVNSTLSYTASKCELLQYKRGNKLLRQPGKKKKNSSLDDCFISCGKAILNKGNANWQRSKGQFSLVFGLYGSNCKLNHALCWTHRCLRRLKQLVLIGFLSFWCRLQPKWLLRSAQVASTVPLHAVLMATFPSSYIPSLPSEENSLEENLLNLNQQGKRDASCFMTIVVLHPEQVRLSRLPLSRQGETKTFGSRESSHRSQTSITEASFSGHVLSLPTGCGGAGWLRESSSFQEDKSRKANPPLRV